MEKSLTHIRTNTRTSVLLIRQMQHDPDTQFKDSDIKVALKRTLLDIAEGYLPISTGSGRQAGITSAGNNYKLSELLE